MKAQNSTEQRAATPEESKIEPYRHQGINEGQARHDERRARQAGAVFVRSLDGYVISEKDLHKLINNQKD